MYEQFIKCQYPNIAAEIHLNQARNPSARVANITNELLEAFLDGKEELKLDEALAIIKYFNGVDRYINGEDAVYRSPRYMLSPKFSYYNTKNKKHFRKIFVVFKQCDNIRQSGKIEKMAAEGKISEWEKDSLLRQLESAARPEEILNYDHICTARINRYKSFLAEVAEAEKRIVQKIRGVKTSSTIKNSERVEIAC